MKRIAIGHRLLPNVSANNLKSRLGLNVDWRTDERARFYWELPPPDEEDDGDEYYDFDDDDAWYWWDGSKSEQLDAIVAALQRELKK